MKLVDVRYYVSFGKGDGSDWIGWSVSLTDEEEKIYDHAVENKIPLNEIPELEDALVRAYKVIEAEEMSEIIVEPSDIKKLINDRDPHALAFFGLEGASDEELKKWNAYNLKEFPTFAEFYKGCEESEIRSPFDLEYSLYVEFEDPNDESCAYE